MKVKEKRRLKRFDLELPAQISLVKSSGEDKMEVQTGNICAEGGFFKTRRPLPVGTEVKIALHLPLDKFVSLRGYCRGSQVNITGKVLRCERSGMSVLFDAEYEMHPSAKENFRNSVS